MAMEGKADFLNQFEKRLGSAVTVETMDSVLSIASEILEGFEMASRKIDAGELADDLLECYQSALSVQGISQKTIDRYMYIIGRMKKHVQLPTRRITVYHLRGYLAAEKARGISDSTIRGYQDIFSAYFNWLQREGLIQNNPSANLGKVKVPKKKKETYSETEMERINRGCKRLRDRAIVHFLASTGARISEMTGLDRDAVDLKTLECTVHGKGNKDRVVYLGEVAGMLLQEYLDTRTDDCEALFVGSKGERKRMNPGGVRGMLRTLAKRAGVDHVYPHKFRRTLATELARRGMPIQEIARILGHERLDTTMEYVVLNDADVKNNYRRYA